MQRTLSLFVLSSWVVLAGLGCASTSNSSAMREESVKPGLNDSFLQAEDASDYVDRFERESREIFQARHEIVRAAALQPGDDVVDIGAGTGLFTMLLAESVGPTGSVVAQDIAPVFIEHLAKRVREAGATNVRVVQGKANSIELPAGSVDVAFLCDVYHHFEFPRSTLRSIHRALKPGGRLVIVDFERIEGVSREWTLGHVRAGKAQVTKEVTDAGFELLGDGPEIEALKENYIMSFRRRP